MTSPNLQPVATSSSLADPPLPFPTSKEWPWTMECTRCCSQQQMVQFINKRKKGGPPVKQCAGCRGMVVWKDDDGEFRIDKHVPAENAPPDRWVCKNCARTMPRVNDPALGVPICIHCGFWKLRSFTDPRNTSEATSLSEPREDETEYELEAIISSYRKGGKLNKLGGKAQLYYTVSSKGYGHVRSELKAEDIISNAAKLVADFHHRFPNQPRPDNYQPPQGWAPKR